MTQSLTDVDKYKQRHAAVWPEVLLMIERCAIQNYSIYLRQLNDGQHYLFSYFEYHKIKGIKEFL